MILRIISAAIIGYLLGSVNTSIIVGKLFGKDIRNYGSKNAGLTNAIRVLGKKAAVFVLLGDVLKGVFACLLSGFLIDSITFPAYIVGGFFAIVGHNWPVFFGFKGGKGALTAVTVAFMIDPLSAAMLLLVFLVVIIMFRFVSLATITTGIFYPVVSYIVTKDIYILVYSIIVAAIIIYKHRSNIGRLLKKTEPKLYLKRK